MSFNKNFYNVYNRFFDSEITIYRFLIGMKKKNLFNVKYVRVYLMLNALKMKSFDYKSIALPAELQGHKMFLLGFFRLSRYFFI